MKRIIFSTILFLSSFLMFAQLSVVGKHRQIVDAAGVDRILVFEKIDNSSINDATEIHFKVANPGTFVEWFEFSDGVFKRLTNVNAISNRETYIEPKANTGYTIVADGQKTTVWVVDLSKLSNKNKIVYQDLNGEIIAYKENSKQTSQANLPDKKPQNDIYTQENPEEEISCKITTETTAREALNENQRPDAKTIDGSAPLEIQFFSNPQGDVRNYFWEIFKEGTLILTRTERDHQYIFTESGKYKVRLTVSNETQTASDSIDVILSESQIMVPSIFTPNGDGFNDEFRVAYTSIAEFQATVVNRWGRVVYTWTNPQTGWDGNINGKPAAEGTYFYIIKAKGADGKPYKLKGHINLLR